MELNINSKTFVKPIKLLNESLNGIEDFMAELPNVQKQKMITYFSKISTVYGFLIGITDVLELKEKFDKEFDYKNTQ
jgi:hypothetical protein